MAVTRTAAKTAARYGVPTQVVAGAWPGVLRKSLTGQDVGTLFVPAAQTIGSRKHWLAYGARAVGELTVDDGAYRALHEQGCSLLPAGLLQVQGNFGLGAMVSLAHPEKGVFARGLASYSADDLRKICGCRTSDIEALLGYKHFDEVVHRDDLVIL